MAKVILGDIGIRTDLRPGDIGYIIHLHGSIYSREYNYGISFEMYVAEGLAAFYRNYNPATERVWVCEHGQKIIGFLLLMSRGEAAQLRYFLISPAYRGIGLGKRLMDLFMEFLHECSYKSCYLWTTDELYTAAGLYKQHGFLLSEEKHSTAFGKPLTEQRYELTVR